MVQDFKIKNHRTSKSFRIYRYEIYKCKDVQFETSEETASLPYHINIFQKTILTMQEESI